MSRKNNKTQSGHHSLAVNMFFSSPNLFFFFFCKRLRLFVWVHVFSPLCSWQRERMHLLTLQRGYKYTGIRPGVFMARCIFHCLCSTISRLLVCYGPIRFAHSLMELISMEMHSPIKEKKKKTSYVVHKNSSSRRRKDRKTHHCFCNWIFPSRLLDNCRLSMPCLTLLSE